MNNCTKCNKSKYIHEFITGRNTCKDCNNLRRRNEYLLKKTNKDNSLTKTCSSCNKILSISFFKVTSGQCNDCVNYKRRLLNEQKRKPVIKPKSPNNKICKYCNCEKDKNLFRRNRLKCRKCENKERSLLVREQKLKDKNYKFRLLMCSRINFILKKINKKKDNKTISYLNCSLDYFANWLNFCFKKKKTFTFENHGEIWDIDHVIPVSKFDFTDKNNITLCFSWFNLMPLESSKNRSKGNKILKKQIKKHLNRLNKFCEKPNEEYLKLCATYLDAGNPLELQATTQ